MPNVIIADTSCLIILSKIDELEILKQLYGSVLITFEVSQEFEQELPNWIITTEVKDKTKVQLINLNLDLGESSSIALAIEIGNCTLILDDIKARKIAQQLGIKISGTLGIILSAKKLGVISLVKPIIDKIKKTNFYISENLEAEILYLSGE